MRAQLRHLRRVGEILRASVPFLMRGLTSPPRKWFSLRAEEEGLGVSDQSDAIAYALSGEPYGRSPAAVALGDVKAMRVMEWQEQEWARRWRSKTGGEEPQR